MHSATTAIRAALVDLDSHCGAVAVHCSRHGDIRRLRLVYRGSTDHRLRHPSVASLPKPGGSLEMNTTRVYQTVVTSGAAYELLQLIREGTSVKEVMSASVAIGDDGLRELSSIRDEDLAAVSTWTRKSANSTGIEYCLLIGCVLCIFKAATASDARKGLLTEMFLSLGIDKTQAYRCIAVWKRAGRTLSSEPRLVYMFKPESLKLLCEKRSPDQVLEEAIQMARDGITIDTKLAKELIHSAIGEVEDLVHDSHMQLMKPTAGQPKAVARSEPQHGKHRKMFVGRVVTVALEFTGDPTDVDYQAVIDDILQVVNQLDAAKLDHCLDFASIGE